MYIVPIYNTIILPKVQYHLVPNLLSEEELERLGQEEAVILLPLKELKERNEIRAEHFETIGVIAKVKSLKDSDEGPVLTTFAEERVTVLELQISEHSLAGSYQIRPDILDLPELEEDQLLAEIKENILSIAAHFQWGPWLARYAKNWNSPYEVISMTSPYLELEAEEKYAILKEDSQKERAKLIRKAIMQLKESLEVQIDVAKKMKLNQNQAYREAAIHKQLEILQKELDDMDPEAVSEEEELLQKIKSAGMPPDTEKEVLRVYNRLKQEGKNSHDYGSLSDYLDFVTRLSWKLDETKEIDIKKARKILDRDHYGLKKIKERILQHIAVMALKKKQSGSIILFVGAPGTGKTSIGKSIAEALNRKYVRISLGGVRDEAEIRGHRRTYVGAMPGRIMEGMKRAGVKNPVVVLDEIDKLSTSYNGDPASALLEVLDPEQNDTFTDHYMNVPYDLSDVLFVCTANGLDGIPKPLLDRMEMISLSGYTPVEKFHIAKDHLIQKALADNGVTKENISITDKILRKVIADYTMEAGVRGLKKQLDKLCRQVAVQLMEGVAEKVSIKEKDLPQLLGKRVSSHDKLLKKGIPGVATGLAWTQAGGDILFIETTAMFGSGRIKLTGKLGDVMKESAEIAASLVKSVFYHEKLDFKEKDIHIHVPSGAVPKDGPSAGITLVTALTSLVTQIPVDRELAMTGEVSLRGQVLPIGGLPEKLMAAERAGIKRVLIPQENVEDLKEVPEETKEKLEIIGVETIEEVITHALQVKLPEREGAIFFDEKEEIPIVVSAVGKNKMPRIKF
jgi:ATP-dependent Lon protease